MNFVVGEDNIGIEINHIKKSCVNLIGILQGWR